MNELLNSVPSELSLELDEIKNLTSLQLNTFKINEFNFDGQKSKIESLEKNNGLSEKLNKLIQNAVISEDEIVYSTDPLLSLNHWRAKENLIEPYKSKISEEYYLQDSDWCTNCEHLTLETNFNCHAYSLGKAFAINGLVSLTKPGWVVNENGDGVDVSAGPNLISHFDKNWSDNVIIDGSYLSKTDIMEEDEDGYLTFSIEKEKIGFNKLVKCFNSQVDKLKDGDVIIFRANHIYNKTDYKPSEIQHSGVVRIIDNKVFIDSKLGPGSLSRMPFNKILSHYYEDYLLGSRAIIYMGSEIEDDEYGKLINIEVGFSINRLNETKLEADLDKIITNTAKNE